MRVHVVTVVSKRRDAIVASLRDLPTADEQELADRRAVIDATATDRLAELGIAREADRLGGVEVEWHRVPDRRHDAVLVYLHGGGYVAGSITSHRDRAGRLAAAAGCDGVVVGYRLAPEHPFPAALDDTVAVCRALEAAGRRVLLAGESAGAGLAIAAMTQLRDAGDALPGATVAVSPWADLTLSSPSLVTRRARDPFVHLDDPAAAVAAYLGDPPAVDPHDPRVSPRFADLTGLPPVLVQVGSEEVLYDDAWRLAEALAAAGGRVVFEEWWGMFHTWTAYAGALEAADAAIAHAGTFLERSASPAVPSATVA